ncbi:MAG: Sec-independent protein translocase protein TatB [Pikeienuella sp.]
MLDIGWQELIVIGIIALLVVGPKELPGLLRTVGRWVGKARGMAREFQRSWEDAAREADLEELNRIREVKRDFENIGRVDLQEQGKRAQAGLTSSAAGSKGPAASSATAPANPVTAPGETVPAASAPAQVAPKPAEPEGSQAPAAAKSGTHD